MEFLKICFLVFSKKVTVAPTFRRTFWCQKVLFTLSNILNGVPMCIYGITLSDFFKNRSKNWQNMKFFESATWRSDLWNKNDPAFETTWVWCLFHQIRPTGSKVIATFIFSIMIVLHILKIHVLTITSKPVGRFWWNKNQTH